MISDSEIDHLCKLAKLEPSRDLKGKLANWLTETIDYIAVLDEIDTSKVSPTSQVTGLTNIFREDKPVNSNELNLLGTYFKTEKVVNK